MMLARYGFMILINFLIAITTFAETGTTDAQPPLGKELWTLNVPTDIRWQKVTDAGFLLVSAQDSLYGIDPETGMRAWTMSTPEDLPEDAVDAVEGTPYVIVTQRIKTGFVLSSNGLKSAIQMIDVTTGQIAWTSKDLGLDNSYGHFLFPAANALLIYGRNQDSKARVTIMADIITGKPHWSSEALFKEEEPALFPIQSNRGGDRKGIFGNQPPLVLPDGNFLECWSKSGLRMLDSKTGNVLGTSPLKFDEVPAVYNDYAPIQLSPDSQIAYIPHDRTIDAVRLSDGTSLWKKSPKLPSKVVQMQLTPQGLVLRGSFVAHESSRMNMQTKLMESQASYTKPFLTVIDPVSGTAKWKDEFDDLLGSSEFVVNGDRVVIYTGFVHNRLTSFDIATGVETPLVKQVKLEGGNDPEFVARLELSGDHHVLLSSQDVMRIDQNGNIVFHNHHKQPGSSLLRAVGKFASGISVTGSLGAARISLNDRERLMKSPTMAKRLKGLDHVGKYATITTALGTADGKKTPGIVKIDKASGADVKCVILGDKKPQYLLDPVEERLFFKKDDQTIVCYSF